MNKKRFSVIVLSYNNYQYIFEAIHSVLIQNYPDIELIIIDDRSEYFDKEEIENYIKREAKYTGIHYEILINELNIGTVKSINRALQIVSGDYIKLLSADDALYADDTLTIAAKALEKNLIITSTVIKCDSNLNEIGMFRDKFTKSLNSISNNDLYKRLCIHNDIVATGVFFTKEIIDKYQLFDERYRLLEDWPAWLKIIRSGDKIVFYDFVSTKYRSNTGSATGINSDYLADKRTVFENEIKQNKERIGIVTFIKAAAMLKIRESRLIRKLYRTIFSRIYCKDGYE
ncbi:MAG: glycosyltransferase [Lachnospiraceae bacterium]|nr:glycosyltransferase [Lachnospiraceae bacterium]